MSTNYKTTLDKEFKQPKSSNNQVKVVYKLRSKKSISESSMLDAEDCTEPIIEQPAKPVGAQTKEPTTSDVMAMLNIMNGKLSKLETIESDLKKVTAMQNQLKLDVKKIDATNYNGCAQTASNTSNKQ